MNQFDLNKIIQSIEMHLKKNKILNLVIMTVTDGESVQIIDFTQKTIE